MLGVDAAESSMEESNGLVASYGASTSVANENDPLLLQRTGSNYSYYDEEGVKSSSRLVPSGRPHCCAVCCTFFSLAGVVYLSLLGAYASAGWNYLHSGWDETEVAVVSRNLYAAAFMYLVTLGISLYHWTKASRRSYKFLNTDYQQMRNLDD